MGLHNFNFSQKINHHIVHLPCKKKPISRNPSVTNHVKQSKHCVKDKLKMCLSCS